VAFFFVLDELFGAIAKGGVGHMSPYVRHQKHLNAKLHRKFRYNNVVICTGVHRHRELLSSLVFECCRSCGDLVEFGGFNFVFEGDASDDFGEVIKAA
jgi:hypothetical protein